MAGRRLGRGLQFLLSDRAEKKQGDASPARAPQEAAVGEESAQAPSSAPESSPEPASSERPPVAPNTPKSDKSTADESTPDTPTPGPQDASEEVDAFDPRSPSSEISVELLSPNPHQPRKVFREDELRGLAESIRASGILQPILARPRPGGRFEIVAGERRFRAAKRAGLTHVPVLVREVDDVDLRLFALVENLQRSDLDPIEKARSFRDIKDATGWTHNKIAENVGFERSHVSNFLRLLELEAPIQKELREGRMSMGHARALLAAPPARRLELAARIRDEGLSVRDVERLAKAKPQAEATEADAPPAPKPRQPAWAREMQENLIEALGCKVAVQARGKRGRVILDVGTRAEFDRVYELLMSTMPGADEEELVEKRSKSKKKR